MQVKTIATCDDIRVVNLVMSINFSHYVSVYTDANHCAVFFLHKCHTHIEFLLFYSKLDCMLTSLSLGLASNDRL